MFPRSVIIQWNDVWSYLLPWQSVVWPAEECWWPLGSLASPGSSWPADPRTACLSPPHPYSSVEVSQQTLDLDILAQWLLKTVRYGIHLGRKFSFQELSKRSQSIVQQFAQTSLPWNGVEVCLVIKWLVGKCKYPKTLTGKTSQSAGELRRHYGLNKNNKIMIKI